MVTVKGRSEPVRTYSVSGKRRAATNEVQARGIVGLDSPLVGRQKEMEALQAVLHNLYLGSGRIVSVIGEAGLGKSRLVAELHKSIGAPTGDDLELAWLEGRSLSYEKTSPYACFIDLFTRLFDLGGMSDEGTNYERLKQKLVLLLPDWSNQADRLAPFLASLLGITPGGEDAELVRYLEPPDLRQRLFQAVGGLVEGLAHRRPTVLVFEDLHWADPTSLDLIESLLPLACRSRLVILAMFRSRRDEPSWRYHELAARDYAQWYLPLALAPLDLAESRQLVANLLHIEDLPGKVRQLILTKAEGNPFFVEEVIRSLLDAELVVRENGHWRATRQIADIAVPDTLVGVISARLDRLAPEPKRLAQTASVIGREFGLEVLEETYEARQSIESSLDILQQRELVWEKSRHPARSYNFKHILTQETAYASMLISQRRSLHLRVAECLERMELRRSSTEDGGSGAVGPVSGEATAGVIARHFLEARETARALPYLVKAADAAAHAYSTSEAIELYTRALEILSSGEGAGLAQRIYEGLSGALLLTGNLPGAIDTYRAMLDHAEQRGDILMQISALNKLARVIIFMGDLGQAGELLDRSEALARRHQDTTGLAEMFTNRCAVCSFTGDFETAAVYLGEATELGRMQDHKEEIIHGLTHKANVLTSLTKFDEAWSAAQEALALAEQAGDLVHISALRAEPIPLYHLHNGDLEAASRSASEALEIAGRIGHGLSEHASALLAGGIALLRGEYESAIGLLQRAAEVGRRVGLPFFEALPLGMLGTAYLELGQAYLEQVDQAHLRALELLEYPTGIPAGGMAWDQLGFCVLQRGQVDQAQELFERGLKTSTLHGLYNRPRFLAGQAAVALRRDRADEASRWMSEARRDAEERSLKHLIPEIALAEGRVLAAQDEWRGAYEAFEQAERLATAMGMRPIIYQARLEQGRALGSLGQVSAAEEKELLATAMREEMGALFNDPKMRAAFLAHAG
jgi:predicted ATPase